MISLEKIKWSNLKQAHGNAEHVPEALRSLASQDSKEQENAYWMLDNYVVLQGDLYESAFYIVHPE